MSDKKNDNNIVKKVFERSGAKSEKVSALFTHYKKAPKVKAKGAPETKSGGKRLPVAIDFGKSHLKLVQLAQDAKGSLEVVLMDEESLGDEPNRAMVTKSKQALEKLLSRNPVGPQAIVGLPANECQLFNFTFPAMAEEELRQAVQMKLKRLRPFDTEAEKVRSAIFRWDAPSTSGQQRVTVVCVSEDNLNQKTMLLNEVGLKPVSVQVCPLSLMYAKRFGNVPKNPDEVVLWLDLGAQESVFIVEKGGVVYFLRNISVNGDQLTKQVAQACKVDEKAAEDLKIAHGLDFWTPQLQNTVMTDEDKAKNPAASVCLALVSTIENLVIDVEHSFKFFSYQVTQSAIAKFDRVVLTGGTSNLKKLDQFLSDRFAVPVNRLDPFQGLKITESLRNQRRDLIDDGLRYASPVGLSLSQFAEPIQITQFMGSGKKAKKPGAPFLETARKKPAFAAVLVGGLLAAMIIPQVLRISYYSQMAASSAKELKQAKANLKQRQTNQLELAGREKTLLEKKATLEEKLSLFKISDRGKQGFSDVLVKIAALLPDQIWVTKLSYTDKKLILVGSTSKNEYVIDFLENLKKPDIFTDVVFNYTKRDGNTSVFSFEVMMGLK